MRCIGIDWLTDSLFVYFIVNLYRFNYRLFIAFIYSTLLFINNIYYIYLLLYYYKADSFYYRF